MDNGEESSRKRSSKDDNSSSKKKADLLERAKRYVEENEKVRDGTHKKARRGEEDGRKEYDRRRTRSRSHSRDRDYDRASDDKRSGRVYSSRKARRSHRRSGADDRDRGDHRRKKDREEDGQSDDSSPSKTRHKKRSRRKRHEDYDRGDFSDSSSSGKRHKKHHRGGASQKKREKEKGKKTNSRNDKKVTSKQSSKPKSKHIDKDKLFPLGPLKNTPPAILIDADSDYFAFHQQLRLYLYRDKGTYFEDLSAEDARAAFSKFVDKYNAGKIEQAYYETLPPESLEECKRTKHEWAFKTSVVEKRSLDMVKVGVRKQTEYKVDSKAGSNAAAAPPIVDKSPRNPIKGPQRNMAEERLAQKATDRRLRQHVRAAEEEMCGGRDERHIEKKKERASAIHGAAKDMEDAATGGVELNDRDIYGSGAGDSFQAALSREKKWKGKFQEKKAARFADLQKKEGDRQAAMLKMLGLSSMKPGQKITMAPRND